MNLDLGLTHLDWSLFPTGSSIRDREKAGSMGFESGHSVEHDQTHCIINLFESRSPIDGAEEMTRWTRLNLLYDAVCATPDTSIDFFFSFNVLSDQSREQDDQPIDHYHCQHP